MPEPVQIIRTSWSVGKCSLQSCWARGIKNHTGKQHLRSSVGDIMIWSDPAMWQFSMEISLRTVSNTLFRRGWGRRAQATFTRSEVFNTAYALQRIHEQNSIFKDTAGVQWNIPKEMKYNLHYGEVLEDILRPPHGINTSRSVVKPIVKRRWGLNRNSMLRHLEISGLSNNTNGIPPVEPPVSRETDIKCSSSDHLMNSFK